MGGVNGINNAELLSPQASDPSQYQCGHIMRDGRLLFSVRGAIVFAKILVQGEGSIGCTNVNGHSDANTNAAEEVDQNHFVQRTRREKLNGWVHTWGMTRRQQCNTMR
uniref:Uncharacterized protein n=1 Tax=Romanomermis culicivorax TaxID=13658 RepID=A0A915KGP3_ROMCU